mmetsp:Transcript_29693/g.43824  ORF Transcript_29693/g.43824 Transcript_29693/m.43824 type:complete len:460 (+) Transcript_29693:142-1521(+)
MTSMMSYHQESPYATRQQQQRQRQLSFASTDDDDDIISPLKTDNKNNKDDDWQPVLKNSRRSSFHETNDADKTPKSKAARKNERRKERRRREKIASNSPIVDDYQLVPSSSDNRMTSLNVVTQSSSLAFEEEKMEEELCRAIAESSLLEGSSNGKEDDPRPKKIRNLRKKLTSAQKLRTQDTLDENQLEKVRRIPILEEEIQQLENQLKEEETQRKELELRIREENENKQQLRLQQWSDLEDGKIVSGFSRYDENNVESDEFACPICAGPLEAATWAIPCKHVFCRACLESAIKSAAECSFGDPLSCVCPLCRACLYDVHTGLVKTRKADTVRRKMKKRSCTCRCGTVISLNGLRAHLRICGSGAPELFGDEEKKKFGHEFEQPILDEEKIEALKRKEGIGKKRRNRSDSTSSTGGGSGRNRSGSVGSYNGGGLHMSVPRGYDEAEAYQRALLLSLEER